MKLNVFPVKNLLWIVPLSVVLGAVLSSLQPGICLIGWVSFSFILFFALCILLISWRWATNQHSAFGIQQSAQPTLDTHRKTLAWMIALAFILRLAAGVSTYILLPINGHEDADDRAGYVFTDAHRRDQQAWDLASSEQSILSAFDRSFHTDQYGGLLAFCALIYRVFSPDAQRPLLLVLLSAFIGALGLPFLWKSAFRLWGEQVALVSGWIFALYPESVLLGGAVMREPYLMTFSAFALWGFVGSRSRTRPYVALGLGIGGMLLVSPVVALVTLVIFAGWLYSTSERGRISWWLVAIAVLIFITGLFLLSSSLNRQGQFDATSPFGIVGSFMREAVKWDVYQLERGSGWVQKLFNHMPAWLRLPFVTIYGIFQPVLPAAVVEPTTLTWKVIALLRAAGWYALLPALVFSLMAAAQVVPRGTAIRRSEAVEPISGAEKDRKVWLWLAFVCWFWILLTSLRGGGDQWDNPRYRAILFLWQALLAGYSLVWWRATRDAWFTQIVLCEIIFLLVFTQWYASRYFHWGSQLPFGGMVAMILGLWLIVIVGGRFWLARRRT